MSGAVKQHKNEKLHNSAYSIVLILKCFILYLFNTSALVGRQKGHQQCKRFGFVWLQQVWKIPFWREVTKPGVMLAKLTGYAVIESSCSGHW